MPYSIRESDYLKNLLRHLSQDIQKYSLEFIFGDESPVSALSLKENIRYQVRESDFIFFIFDGKNINVFWDMGMAYGLDKPYLTAFTDDISIPEGSITITDPSIIHLKMDEGDGLRLSSAFEYFLDGLSRRKDLADKLIFMCHRTLDKPAVEPLALSLEGMGYRVWYDSWNILPGDSIVASISKGIKVSTHFLILLSKNTHGSSWVSKELNTALSLALDNNSPRIIPIFLDKEGRESMPTLLRELRGVEFFGKTFKESFEELQKGLI